MWSHGTARPDVLTQGCPAAIQPRADLGCERAPERVGLFVRAIKQRRHRLGSGRQAREVLDEVGVDAYGQDDLIDVPDAYQREPLGPRDVPVDQQGLANTRGETMPIQGTAPARARSGGVRRHRRWPYRQRSEASSGESSADSLSRRPRPERELALGPGSDAAGLPRTPSETPQPTLPAEPRSMAHPGRTEALQPPRQSAGCCKCSESLRSCPWTKV
jgi:hypothetical protein